MPGSMRMRSLVAERPPLLLGIVVAVAAVGVATGLVYPLKAIAPAVSLSVVYLLAVLLISAAWGLGLGLLTALLSAAAFNFFHLPPVGRFTIADSRNWVALAAFTVVAIVVSTIADLARSQTLEAERRLGEADLAAALARELLAGSATRSALGGAARALTDGLRIPAAAIELGRVADSDRRIALPLHGSGGEQLATLLVPRTLDEELLRRLRERVVPSLEALVTIALHRDAAQAEVVETAALRRSDELKTALLRAVSHDLRSPLTAIVAAGHALGVPSLTDEERTDLSTAIVQEGERLEALVSKLLDLSRLQSGRATPRADWISIEEVIAAAAEALPEGGRGIRVTVEPDVPALRADPAQLQQAFANLLENARRYSGRRPVTVHVRRAHDHVLVSVVDQGPGIAPPERERIFEPFYRGTASAKARWTGSGLGLAIARGFVEAAGGTISVQSLPGQGTSFVVELPLPAAAGVAG